MSFTVDKNKLAESLIYIISKYGEASSFYILKTLYFAEYNHLRKYGRPIVGDRMVAMEHGPVPSAAYNMLKNASTNSDIEVMPAGKHFYYKALREANLEDFSKSDLTCLDTAYEHCVNRSFGSISDETHKHKAWDNAPLNGTMNIEDMLDGVDEETKDDVKVFLSYGVL